MTKITLVAVYLSHLKNDHPLYDKVFFHGWKRLLH
jgi:hypothetical protein